VGGTEIQFINRHGRTDGYFATHASDRRTMPAVRGNHFETARVVYGGVEETPVSDDGF